MSDCRETVCHLLYPSPAQHFANALAIAACTLNLSDRQSPIPIQPTKQPGHYRSAIALTLDSQNSPSLAQDLSAIAQSALREKFGDECQVTSHDSGWIELQISTGLQLAFLTQLAKTSPELNPPMQQCNGPKLESSLLFDLQYAHARCCSVLRLAQRRCSLDQSFSVSWLDAYFSTQTLAIEQVLLMTLINFPNQFVSRKIWLPTHERVSGDSIGQNLVTVAIPTPVPGKLLQGNGHVLGQLFQKFYGSAQLFHLPLPEAQNLFTLRVTLFQAFRNLLSLILEQFYQQPASQIL